MNFENIIFSVDELIAAITVNRPQKMNALNFATLKELDSALNEIYKNEDIKAAYITGAGEKSFIAGADIKELSQLTASEATQIARNGQDLFLKIENCPKPIIALVNGFALGGGCELAMACHFRYASPTASFGQPEVNLGLIAGYGGTQRLPRLVGKGIALELLISADIINAQRAFEIGLVNKIVENDSLLAEGKKVLTKIISKGPVAVKYCIEAVNKGLDSELEAGLKREAAFFGDLFSTKDMLEGTSAFLQKRKPAFKGQ